MSVLTASGAGTKGKVFFVQTLRRLNGRADIIVYDKDVFFIFNVRDIESDTGLAPHKSSWQCNGFVMDLKKRQKIHRE